jgi:hypothetical protein
MRKPRHTRDTVLITGASQEIGYELACLFAADGYDLVLVSADEKRIGEHKKKLEKRYSITIRTIIRDLSDPEAVKDVFAELQNDSIGIDVLVNNAGIATHGFFFKTDFETERKMLQLNIGALTHLTKLFLPEMLARGSGRILNISSNAAFKPGPLMAVYYATKAYVRSFSEALAEELEGTGVSVTALCPGPKYKESSDERGDEVSIMQQKIADAKTMAYIGYKGLLQGKVVVTPSLRTKLLTQLSNLQSRVSRVQPPSSEEDR